MPQSALQKRITVRISAYFALIFLFTGCGSLTGATDTPVSYTPGTGQVIIRLVDAPGNIFPSLRAIPTWELYGDGTFLYQSQATSSDTLLQARLQPTEIAHILDVVVNQDTFFADPKSLYGKMTPDIGELILTIHTKKQQKTVSLFSENGAPPEDQHMFSILHFLQSYQPPSSHPYAAPGAVVLVRPYVAVNSPVMQWPYPDISLQQVAAQECQTLYNSLGNPCAVTTDSSGYFPIYGKRGTDLLSLLTGSQTVVMNQGGQTYAVLAWPLLPENLLVQADGKQWVETFGMNAGKWPLLAGAH